MLQLRRTGHARSLERRRQRWEKNIFCDSVDVDVYVYFYVRCFHYVFFVKNNYIYRYFTFYDDDDGDDGGGFTVYVLLSARTHLPG